MTPPELRITDAEAAAVPRRDVTCAVCRGDGSVRSYDDDYMPTRDWCHACGGAATWSVPALPRGASARIGAVILAVARRSAPGPLNPGGYGASPPYPLSRWIDLRMPSEVRR